MLEFVEVFTGEIILIVGMIVLAIGIMRIIKLFARHSRWINP